MQIEEAVRLHKRWIAKGNLPCEHHLDMEYYLDSHTGDYVCTTCGQSFDPDEVAQIREKRKKPPAAK